MAEKIRLTKTGITAPMYCEPAAVDYWVNERGWVIDPTDQVPGPPGSQPVTRDELAAFGIATGKAAVAIPTGTAAAVGDLLAVATVSGGVATGFTVTAPMNPIAAAIIFGG